MNLFNCKSSFLCLNIYLRYFHFSVPVHTLFIVHPVFHQNSHGIKLFCNDLSVFL